MADEPVDFGKIQGAPTPENLQFKENWVRSGGFQRALAKTWENKRDADRLRRERGVEDARYLVRDGLPIFRRHRKSGTFMPMPKDSVRRRKSGDPLWVEVSPGRWRLVL